MKPYLTKDNFIFVDGIRIGRLVDCNGIKVIEFCDKDKFRSNGRGTRFVGITITDLEHILDSEPPPAELT